MNETLPEVQASEPHDSRNWRTVYCVVVGIFTLWVILLTALSRAFQ